MSMNLLALTSDFIVNGDRGTSAAWFRTRVPWIAPEAYLHVIYKPARKHLLNAIGEKWSFPSSLIEFLEVHNGAILFSGAIVLFGVVGPNQLINREDRFSLPPFNIEDENESWSLHPDRLLVIGGYQYDGSRVCVDRSDETIHVFKRRQREPLVSWVSIDEWLKQEVARLCRLYDREGRRVSSELETGPPH